MRTFLRQLASVIATLFVLAIPALDEPVSAGSPPFGQRSSDWVEGTQALDDGATRDYYNRAAALPWDNLLGRLAGRRRRGPGADRHTTLLPMVDDDTDRSPSSGT